jgi:hypothetical protein
VLQLRGVLQALLASAACCASMAFMPSSCCTTSAKLGRSSLLSCQQHSMRLM